MELIISDDHAGLRNAPQSSISISLGNDAFSIWHKTPRTGCQETTTQRDRRNHAPYLDKRPSNKLESRGQRKIIGSTASGPPILALG